MIGISIATKWEWDATLEYYNKDNNDCTKYPYGEYFKIKINNKDIMFYSTGARKVHGIRANQYMISKFNLTKVIVVGTCAGIDDTYNNLDIFIPNKAVQYDCTVKEVEPLIKQSFRQQISSPFATKNILHCKITTYSPLKQPLRQQKLMYGGDGVSAW